MSSDLLAEFDSFYTAPQSVPQSNTASSKATNQPASSAFSFFDPPDTTLNSPNPPQPQWNPSASKQDHDIWGDFNKLQIGSSQRTSISVADPWGSFEIPLPRSDTAPAYTTNTNTNLGFGAINVPPQKLPNHPSEPKIQRRPTLDLFSSKIVDAATKFPTTFPPQNSNSQPAIIQQNLQTNPGDILFDADEELEDDDDFGDFETVDAPISPAPPASAVDLLALDFPPIQIKVPKKPDPVITKSSTLVVNSFPYPQAPKSPSFRERNPFAELAIKTPTTADDKPFGDIQDKRDSPVTAWPTYVPPVPKRTPYKDSPAVKETLDDDWGEFADFPSNPLPEKPTTGIEADAWVWDSVDKAQPTNAIENNELPPTNIPPPSILLTLFPQLFNLPQSALFKPVSGRSHSIKNRILSDPTTITFLRSYLALVNVCAHIIAGRKLRWKRDTILAQAMKIGPSAVRGKGGMKLTGVDKAETTREDREVADVIRIWHEQVGRLRSAAAAANAGLQSKGEYLIVPEIGETMMVKTEGGLSAPKSCVLCGMKREERIAKIDIKIEDSFGEWWVEHWGHRICRNFWREHEGKLRGR